MTSMTVLFLLGLQRKMSHLASTLKANVVLGYDLFFDEGRDHPLNLGLFFFSESMKVTFYDEFV